MENKNNEKLIELVKQNPDLPIITATYYEVVAEDWGYWVGEIQDICVDYFYMRQGKDRWFAGEDDIFEHLYFTYESNSICEMMSDEEYNKFLYNKFNEMVSNKEIVKAIIIYISN